LYTGGAGQSHFEELSLSDNPQLASLWKTEGIQFRKEAALHFTDWHSAPRQQWVIIIQGELEIGLGDGSI
jgi:hypothetical protein